MGVDKKNNWLADAAKIDLGSFEIGKYIAKTAKVTDFIEAGRFIVAGPKGYGKTLLLKYAYQNVPRDSGYIRIPIDTPVDTFDNALPYDYKKLAYLSNPQTWDYLWQVGLGGSIILSYALSTRDAAYLQSFIAKLKSNSNKFSSFLNLCSEILSYIKKDIGIPRYIKVQANPSAVMGLIMASPLSSIRSSIDWTKECVHQYCLGVDRPILAFVDQIDQGAKAYPIEIWKAAQLGLVSAIFKLHSPNRQIKIYGSIRKEAWDSCEDELASQYEDYVCDLSYTEKDLQQIFEHAIKTFETETSVTIRDKYDSAPIEAFVGMEKLNNTWGIKKERPFSYMCRHSLRRPRDLILFGKEIHQLISGNNFNKSAFVELVNRIPGEEIQRQYLKEALPFTNSLQHINSSLFFERIKKNVFTSQELIEICAQTNTDITCIAKNGGDCRDCLGASHLFCDLYKIGLLGVVIQKEIQSGELIQYFEVPGVVRSGHLPKSEFYLLHPALDHYIQISQGNFEFSPVKGVVIGNGYQWESRYNALLLISDIRNWLKDSGIVGDTKIYTKIDRIYEVINIEDSELIFIELSDFKKYIENKESLLVSSQFITDILFSTNKLLSMFESVGYSSKESQVRKLDEDDLRSVDITKHNFEVALSFPGEIRNDVESIATILEENLGSNSCFYDNNYKSQLARPSIDILLQEIYGKRSKLIVVFLCDDYQEKEWCGIEFRAIREIIMEKNHQKVMFIKMGEGKVDGIFKIDGYIDGCSHKPNEIAGYIQERVKLSPS